MATTNTKAATPIISNYFPGLLFFFPAVHYFSFYFFPMVVSIKFKVTTNKTKVKRKVTGKFASYLIKRKKKGMCTKQKNACYLFLYQTRDYTEFTEKE
mgnify:CR=1 FL=1